MSPNLHVFVGFLVDYGKYRGKQEEKVLLCGMWLVGVFL